MALHLAGMILLRSLEPLGSLQPSCQKMGCHQICRSAYCEPFCPAQALAQEHLHQAPLSPPSGHETSWSGAPMAEALCRSKNSAGVRIRFNQGSRSEAINCICRPC